MALEGAITGENLIRSTWTDATVLSAGSEATGSTSWPAGWPAGWPAAASHANAKPDAAVFFTPKGYDGRQQHGRYAHT